MSEPAIIVAIITGAVTLFGSVLLFVSTRGKTVVDSKQALDARIDERVGKQLDVAWKKIDELTTTVDQNKTEMDGMQQAIDDLNTRDKRKMSAVARIFKAIQRQWPTSTGPNLDPADIAEIEDTIPPEWIRDRPPATAG